MRNDEETLCTEPRHDRVHGHRGTCVNLASILSICNFQYHAQVSLRHLRRAAETCESCLRRVSTSTNETRLSLRDHTSPHELTPARSRRSHVAKLKLQIPKTSHLVNPKGPGENDKGAIEKSINVVTSLPFLAVGARTLRRRSCNDLEGRVYGWSMLAMGSAATLYHAAHGKLRTALRKADYYTISLSCMAMADSLRVQHGPIGRAFQAASVATLPFRPSAVTACHAAQMELAYMKRAKGNAEEWKLHKRHMFVTSAGLACFALEDPAIKRGIHVTHPLWHCLACYAMSSVRRPQLAV